MKRLDPSLQLENSNDVLDDCGPVLRKVKITPPTTANVPKGTNQDRLELKPSHHNDFRKFMFPPKTPEKKNTQQQVEDLKAKAKKNCGKDDDHGEEMKSAKENINLSDKEKQAGRQKEKSPAQEARNSSASWIEEEEDPKFEVEETFDVSGFLEAQKKILESRRFDLSLKKIKKVGARTLAFAGKTRTGFQNFTIFDLYNHVLSLILSTIGDIFSKDLIEDLDLQHADCNEILKKLTNQEDKNGLKYTILLNLSKKENKTRLPVFIFKVKLYSMEKEKVSLQNYFHKISQKSKLPIYGLLFNQNKAVFMSFNLMNGQTDVKYSRVLDHPLNDYLDGKEPSPRIIDFCRITTAMIVNSIENGRKDLGY